MGQNMRNKFRNLIIKLTVQVKHDKQNTYNKLRDVAIGRDYIGGGQANYYITLYQESEREFVVTRHADIRPVYYFTGRDTDLQDLRQMIENRQKSVLVSGMGGIGKTHICRKLFQEYQDLGESGPFRHIGYIEYAGDMDSSLQDGLKFKQQDNPEQNREAAWEELEHLAADGKLLLFVDNVDKTMREDIGLERLNSIPGAVVLTSRRTALGRGFKPYKIGFLSTEQCREIYEKIRFEGSGRKVLEEEELDLEYVIEKLAARHTITIELLAHLARTKSWSVRRLRKELEEKGFQLGYRDEEEGLVNIQESYEKLYNLSELTEAEQNILEAFSVFPYIPLAAETCNEWLLADADVSEDDDILIGLYQKGWLQFDIGRESYILHPVFAQFINEKCKPEADNYMGLIWACQESLEIPEDGSTLKCQKYIPFAENIMEKIDMKDGLERAEFIEKLVYLLQYIAEYAKAEKLYAKSLSIWESVLGENHLITAKGYNNLANIYYKQGKYKKAEDLFEKSLRIRKRVLGEGHPDTAASYNNLAGVYLRQGDYKKAEKLYKKSLQISEKEFGREHSFTALGYNNLAVVYKMQQEYKKAEELYEKSLHIRERVLGKEHPDTAASFNNLAGIYAIQGDYEKAKGLYEKSLHIKERVLGEEHPDTAMSYNNLAGVYFNQSRYESALTYYVRAYKVFINKFSFEHPYTKDSLQNIKISYAEWNPEGDFEKWLEEQMKE